jgi:hypothetical protein
MCNLKPFSQIFRIILGSILIAAAWFGPQTSLLSSEFMKLWAIGWIGLVPLISGIAAFCPVYAVFGRGHNPETKKEANQ